MKKTLKKLLICILIILIINNFFISNISFAADPILDWLTDILGSVVGLLTYPIRIVAVACGMAIDTLTKSVAESQGSVDASGNIVDGTFINNGMITPFDIFFNKIALIDVNFFNIINDGSIISNIRNSIAGWYYVMRMIAAAILLCVLIYVGIRMAISTVASDKAAYKKMLVDWVCSLALIFLLQYIILFTFAVNDAFIKGLSGINDGKSLCDAMVNIKKLAVKFVDVNSIPATIVFCMLVAQTLGLLISYFNRMLKLAFLVIIAPLITLTYSIDKMGDGKAQALGTWLKEFIYTVLLQTFHCIIYMAFVSMALSIFTKSGADDSSNLAGAVLAVLCVKFTKEAEKILGKIFSFSDSTSESSITAGMALSAAALSKAGTIGKGARTTLNGAKGMVGNVKNLARNARVEALAVGAMMHGAKDSNGNKISFAEAKDQAETALTEKEAAKEELKNAKKYGVKTKDKDYDDKVQKAIDANKKAGMSEGLAKAKARAQVAKQTRADNIKNNPKGARDKAAHLLKHNKVRGAINKARSVASQSETLREIGKMVNGTMAAGVGTFLGGAMYGTGEKAFTAFTSGAAMYRGTKEFMKNSTKTLSNDVTQRLQGAGITDVADAGAHINKIMQDSDRYENADKEIEDIFKELEQALDGLSDRDKKELRHSIKNVVNNEMTRNPAATNESIMDKINEDKEISEMLSLHTKPGQEGAARESIEGFIDFKREKGIYDTVKNAGNIGLSPDAFIATSLKQFERDLSGSDFSDSRSERKENKQLIETAKERTLDQTEIEEFLEGKEPEIVKRLEKQMESEISTLQFEKSTLASEGIYDTPEIDAQIKTLEDSMKKLSDTAVAAHRKKIQTEFEELQKQVDNLVAEENKKIEEANEKMKELHDKIGNDRTEVEKKIDELERERAELEAQRTEFEALMQHARGEYKETISESKRFGTKKAVEKGQDYFDKKMKK